MFTVFASILGPVLWYKMYHYYKVQNVPISVYSVLGTKCTIGTKCTRTNRNRYIMYSYYLDNTSTFCTYSTFCTFILIILVYFVPVVSFCEIFILYLNIERNKHNKKLTI